MAKWIAWIWSILSILHGKPDSVQRCKFCASQVAVHNSMGHTCETVDVTDAGWYRSGGDWCSCRSDVTWTRRVAVSFHQDLCDHSVKRYIGGFTAGLDVHPKGQALHAFCTGSVWLADAPSAQSKVDAVNVAYLPREQVNTHYVLWSGQCGLQSVLLRFFLCLFNLHFREIYEIFFREM